VGVLASAASKNYPDIDLYSFNGGSRHVASFSARKCLAQDCRAATCSTTCSRLQSENLHTDQTRRGRLAILQF